MNLNNLSPPFGSSFLRNWSLMQPQNGAALCIVVLSCQQEVYSRPNMAETFDCVATSFFIDTAHNILEYIEVVAHVLKRGGFWINLGPLLYHWVEHQSGGVDDEDLSIEIPLEDVENAAMSSGFVRLTREMVPAPYLGEESWEVHKHEVSKILAAVALVEE